MKRILITAMVMLMLAGCSGQSSEGSSDPVKEETVHTLDDGIIPYLTSHVIHLEYDVIKKDDQQFDYTMNFLYRLTPMKKEGAYYDAIRNAYSEEELDGELFLVSEWYLLNWNFGGASMDLSDINENFTGEFWVMKDDPEKKILTIYKYSTFQDDSGQLDGINFGDGKSGDRFVVDYSGMDEDDWSVKATEMYQYADLFPGDALTYDGYMTVYEPVEGIGNFEYIVVKEEGIRIRTSPEIRDDNKIGSLNAFSSDFSFSFFVYEKTENEGYTWYRIGKKRWIASDGTWIDEVDPEKEAKG